MLGYYHSDARYAAADLNPVARRIADRLHDRQPSSVVLLLDNRKLGTFCMTPGPAPHHTSSSASAAVVATAKDAIVGATECPFELFVKDGSKGWRRGGGEASLSVGGGGRSGSWATLRGEFLTMFKAQQQRDLCDFDEHLDDASKCFFNVGFPGSLRARGRVQGQ